MDLDGADNELTERRAEDKLQCRSIQYSHSEKDMEHRKLLKTDNSSTYKYATLAQSPNSAKDCLQAIGSPKVT
jgi:hypothetical protein